MESSVAQVVQLVARQTRQQQHRSGARRLARGAIIGIAIAAFCVLAFTVFMLWCCCCRGRKKSPQNSYAGWWSNRQGGMLNRFTGRGQQHQQPPMAYSGQPGYGAPQYPGGAYTHGPQQEAGYYR